MNFLNILMFYRGLRYHFRINPLPLLFKYFTNYAVAKTLTCTHIVIFTNEPTMEHYNLLVWLPSSRLTFSHTHKSRLNC